MKKIITLLLPLLMVSCAGIINGTSQTVTFNSSPSGAEVLIDGTSRGMTPLTVKLKKNKYETVMLKKKGYNAVTRPLEKVYDSTALLNVFWDSSTTDMMSGAAYEYEPNSYHFNLEKASKQWIFNNGRLDRNPDRELKEFVLMYYFEIKNDHADSKTKYLNVLKSNLSAKVVNVDSLLNRCITKSINAVNLLQCLN